MKVNKKSDHNSGIHLEVHVLPRTRLIQEILTTTRKEIGREMSRSMDRLSEKMCGFIT